MRQGRYETSSEGTAAWEVPAPRPAESRPADGAGVIASEASLASSGEHKSPDWHGGVFQASPYASAVLAADGSIVAVNAAWEEFASGNGAAGMRWVGLNYLDACRSARGLGEEDAGAVLNGLRSVLDGTRATFEYRYSCHSPEQMRWYRLIASPVASGATRLALVTHVDVSDAVLRDDELREWKTAFPSADDTVCMWRVTPAGLVQFSDDAPRVLSTRRERLALSACVRLVDRRDRRRAVEVLRSSGGNRPFEVELRLRAGDGERWVRVRGAASKDDSTAHGSVQALAASKRSRARLHHLESTLSLLSGVRTAASGEVSEEQLLDACCRTCVNSGGYLSAAWLPVGTNGLLMRSAERGGERSDGRPPREWPQALLSRAMHTRKLALARAVARPTERASAEGDRILLLVPACAGSTMLGAIGIEAHPERELTLAELRALRTLGRDVGLSLGATRDREEARKAIQRHAEQTTLLDRANDGISLLSLDGQIEYWNQGAARLYGWSAAEAVGRNVQDLIFGPDPQAYRSALRKVLTDGEHSTDLRAKPRNGGALWVNATWTLIRDASGAPSKLLAICADITAQREAAQEIARSRALLSTAMVTAGLATVQIGTDNGAVIASDRLQEVLRLQGEPEHVEDILKAFSTECRVMLGKLLRPAKDKRGHPSKLLRLQGRRGGQARWLRVRWAAPPTELSATTTLVFQDVTAAIRAREAVLRLNEELEQRVRERTRELEAANRELAAFSYSVSHDLKAPLAALDGFGLLLAPRLQPGDAVGARYLENIRSGVATMFSLIEAMLSLARLTSAGGLQTEPVDLAPIAASIVDELRAGEPDRAVRVDIQDAMVVQCNAGLLTVALRNLVGNAWKFSAGKPDAHVCISAEVERSGDWAVIRVEDNGSGFDPGQVHRLFTPFQRLHRQAEFPGTGIGLATVQRVVNRHGGMVAAEGRPGSGAVFTIRLPQRASDPSTGHGAAESTGAGSWFD